VVSFLTELDAQLNEPTALHCIGGFVVNQVYGFERETADIDLLGIIPQQMNPVLTALAGTRSPLHRKDRVYMEHMGVVSYPDNYDSRLIRVFPCWPNIRLWALEPHDLALTKLERSIDRDVRDVVYLAKAGLIDRETLISRFHEEMRPYLRGPTPTWHDTTLKMWTEACWPSE